MLRPLITFMIFICFVMPALAASSQWQDLGGGQVRLHAAVDANSRSVNAVLEVQLKQGWSTYWRYPGSAGIPPIFNFSDSIGIEFGEAEFPVPIKLGDGVNSYAGYKNSVLFPINGKLIGATPPAIDLKLLIGVCEVICIPAQAHLTLEAGSLLQTDPNAFRMMTLAKLGLPRKIEANEIVQDISLDGEAILLKLKTKSKNIALFVEGPRDWNLYPAHLLQHDQKAATFSFNVAKTPKNTDVLATPLRYTLSFGTSGVEFTR
ncbi:MAG: protein-disulfide reductase DsbD domain-containing protein [Pseudomonadota bacterium]